MSSLDDQKFSNLISALNEVMARQARLEARLTNLEQTLSLKAASPQEVEPAPTVVDSSSTRVEAPRTEEPVVEAAVHEEPITQPQQSERPALETKLGLTILNRIGVVTLVLGIGFFFKWAADNNWVGPSGRVILGLIGGFATLAFADALWRKGQQIFAQGITGTGIAIIYLALYAAFDFYRLIPQTAAFVLLLASTSMAATLALRYNAVAIAALGFSGAYLIPLLLSNGEDHPWFLLAYLLLINLAVTELASRRHWRRLELLSLVATVGIFGEWLVQNGWKATDRFPATVGVLALCAQRFRTSWRFLFSFTHFLTAVSIVLIWNREPHTYFPLAILVAAGGLAFAHYRSYPAVISTAFAGFWLSVWLFDPRTAANITPVATAGYLVFSVWMWWRSAFRNETATVRDMSVFVLNGLAYYALAYSVLQHEYHHWLGLLAVAVAASYLAFGIYLHRKSVRSEQDLRMVLLALGISVAFLTLAIPVQLTGFTVTIAWSIQAAALTWIGLRLNSTRAVLAAFVVFGLALVRLAVVDSGMYPDVNAYILVFNARFLAFTVLATALLLAAYWSSKLDRTLALIHFIAGHIVLLAGLCMEVTGWAVRSARPGNELSVETIGITILFAVYGVVLVSFGVVNRSAVSRLAGLALTAIAILKLYFYDVWQLGRVYQIIAFVILGILLLSTSFLYSRFKGLVDDWWRQLPTQEKDESSSL